MENIENIAFHR